MFAQLSLLAVLVAAVFAQQPAPCIAPGLFSANLLAVCMRKIERSIGPEPELTSAQYNSQQQAQAQAHYYYDQFLQRKARYEVVDFQNGFASRPGFFTMMMMMMIE